MVNRAPIDIITYCEEILQSLRLLQDTILLKKRSFFSRIYLGMQKFHAGFVLDLLAKLDEVEDYATGRTFLDNSLVVWIGEQAVRQADTDLDLAHDSNDLPVFMVGSLGGTLKTGQYLNYQLEGMQKQRWPRYSVVPGLKFPFLGRALNEWQISVMTAMGLSPEEWERNGLPGFGSYVGNYDDQYRIGDRRSVLTELFT